MSFKLENVIWQSENGTWNIGFYERMAGGSHFDQDYDPEWDDEFDHNNFQFASCGHPTEEAAYDAWQGGNPGSHDVVAWTPQHREYIDTLEDLAAKLCQQQPAHHRSNGVFGYQGPPRRRIMKALKTELDTLVEQWVAHQLGGYANLHETEHETILETQIVRRLNEANPEDLEIFETSDAAHIERLQDKVEQATTPRYSSNGHRLNHPIPAETLSTVRGLIESKRNMATLRLGANKT